MYVCVYVCVYICMYVRSMYVFVYVYVCNCGCMYISPCVRAYECMYVQNVSADKIQVQTSKMLSSHQKEKKM